MDIDIVKDLLNGDKELDSNTKSLIERYKDVYYSMSLHISGACPRYYPLGERQTYKIPPNYFGIEYQRIFIDRLLARHPREGEDTFQWRLSQYKPITKTPFLQIIELIISAIFQDSNYSIDIPNDADSEFIQGNNFEGYDLIGWFSNIGLPSIIEDPNGLIIRIPTSPHFEQTSDKLQVTVMFLHSKDIVFRSDNELVFKRGNMAFYMDRNSIWRLSLDQENKYYISAEDQNGYYATMFNKLPITVAGGVWNTHGFFDSFLVKAQAVADEFISSYSAEQLVDKEASHPFIVQGQSDCAYCDGTGKEVIDCETCEGGIEQVQCHVCKGKKTMSTNPGERMLVPIEEMKNDQIKIVNPDTTINSYHHNKNKDVYNSILEALNLLKTDKAQSGAAKAIDQERLYFFISRIANHLFDKVIYDTIGDIISYRNASSKNGVLSPHRYSFHIIKPTQYQIKTSDDLLLDYGNGVKDSLPIFLRSKMAKDYIDKMYSGDMLMQKKADIIADIDITYCYNESEKQTLLLTGAVQRSDLQKSVQLPSIIDAIIRTKGQDWFMKATFIEVEEEVTALFTPVNVLQVPVSNKNANGLTT